MARVCVCVCLYLDHSTAKKEETRGINRNDKTKAIGQDNLIPSTVATLCTLRYTFAILLLAVAFSAYQHVLL